MFSVLRLISHAEEFRKFLPRDLLCVLMPSYWNNLIRIYATSKSKGCIQKDAIRVFLAMRRSGVSPDEFTFPVLFKSCASLVGLSVGKQLHGDVLKRGLCSNLYVQNSLIHFYGSSKNILDARNVFDEMSFRTVVSWNSVLSACNETESIRIFFKMLRGGVCPEETTMVILLSSCAQINNLNWGKLFHSQVIIRGMILNCQLGSALVHMYGKCGMLDQAKLIFNNMDDKNVWTWSSMILGLALHGSAEEALQLFKQMKICMVEPNHVTFLGVLCACSYGGLVEDGRRLFHEMQHVHDIKPEMVHYGAMVDMLSRGGKLKEAYNFILDMPIEADAIIWRTLLSACHIHGGVGNGDDSGIGELVKRKLLELEPWRSGNLVLVANNYARDGMWERAELLRKNMNGRGLKNRAGWTKLY